MVEILVALAKETVLRFRNGSFMRMLCAVYRANGVVFFAAGLTTKQKAMNIVQRLSSAAVNWVILPPARGGRAIDGRLRPRPWRAEKRRG